uniref:conjugal transfer protein TrbE n=1 Tax=Escherichia coli TaxID=562 RepID=UPI001BD14EFA|nr:conjugal transfer protein TrbE [Escherichia coli]QUN01805.1 IncF plasmid conjugative transfer protein TrbE [Escherichia coli]
MAQLGNDESLYSLNRLVDFIRANTAIVISGNYLDDWFKETTADGMLGRYVIPLPGALFILYFASSALTDLQKTDERNNDERNEDE